MPFDVDEPTTRTYWAGEGVAILLADDLDAIGVEAVGREERVAVYDELRLPVSPPPTRATMIRMAEAAEAAFLVAGRVGLGSEALSVRARVLRLDTGTYLPEIVEQGPPHHLFVLTKRLARRVATAISGRADPATPGPATGPAGAPSLEAFESYVKGLLDERPDARLRLLEAALARQPDLDRARLAMWEVHTEAGRHEAAVAAVRPVAVSSPHSRQARFLASRSLLDLGQYDEAFATLRGLLDERPSAAVYGNLGVVQLRRPATPQAGRATYYLTKATELAPDDGDIAFNLGYAYWWDRDPQAAVYWLREAVRRNPADADAHFALGAALTAAGAEVEAGRERELAGRLSSRYEDWDRRGNPRDAVPRGIERVMTGVDTMRESRFDAALATAAQRDSRELTAFYLDRGRRLFEQERNGEAIAELRRALYLSPYDAEAHLLLGRACLRTGRAAEAATALRLSIWSQDSATAHEILAEALIELKEPAAARAEAMRALVLDPSLERARSLITRIDQGLPK
jgi:Flp pilus assembly protein TadD